MKIMIFEDEKIAANRLCQMLQELHAEADVVAIVEGIKSGLQWLRENAEPDLIFMDIQLADGICFELFDQIKISCPVIFVTAFDKFAIQAFKFNSLDYILKPLSQKDLNFAMQKFLNLQSQTKLTTTPYLAPETLKTLLNLLKPNYKSRFFIKINNTIHSIPTKEINFFYSADSNTLMTNSLGRNFVIDFTLDDLEKVLNPDSFFRINRKYLVHIDAIEKIQTYSKGRIQINLKQGPVMALQISRAKTKGFREWLGQ